MIVEQIDLINFKKYSQERVVLGKRVLGIFGDNGSGKSTIFDAICWCLYGVVPTIGKEGQKMKQDELVRDGEDEMGVELEFTYSDQPYTVARYYSKTDGTKARILVDGVLEATSSKDVTRYITQTLGLDARAFISSSFIRQNELDLLTSQRPSKRRDIINRLFNLQLYDGFLEDTKALSRECSQSISAQGALRDSLEREICGYEALIKDARAIDDSLKDVEKDISAIMQKISEVRRQQELSGELWARIREKNEQKKSFAREMASHASRAAELETGLLEALRARRDIQRCEHEIAMLMPDMERYRHMSGKKGEHMRLESCRTKAETALASLDEAHARACRALERRMGEALERRSSIKKSIREEGSTQEFIDTAPLKSSLESVRAELETIRESCYAERSKMEAGKAREKEIGDRLAAYESLDADAKCPTCDQVVSEMHRKSMVGAACRELATAQKATRYHSSRVSRISSLEEGAVQKLKDIEMAIEGAQAENERIRAAVERRSRLEDALKGADGAIASIEREAEAERMANQQRRDKLQDEMLALNCEMSSLGFDPSAYAKLDVIAQRHDSLLNEKEVSEARANNHVAIEKGINGAKKRISELEADVSELEGQLQSLKEEVALLPRGEGVAAPLEKELGRLQGERGGLLQQAESNEKVGHSLRTAKNGLASVRVELEGFSRDLREYAALEDAFKSIPVNIHERLKPLLQAEVSSLLSEVTGGKYAAVRIGEDYALHVLYDGDFFPIYRFSGGEKDLINLCLRIGISRVLVSLSKIKGFAHMESLFLDETFSSLDEHRRMALISVLNRLESYFSQIVIITHVDSLRELIPNHILVEENEDDTSTPVQVSCAQGS